MEEALIWVLMMVAIALAAITVINYWSDAENYSQNRLVNYCAISINSWWWIISHWLLSWRKTITPKSKEEPKKQLTTQTKGLLVDFKKTWPIASPCLPSLLTRVSPWEF